MMDDTTINLEFSTYTFELIAIQDINLATFNASAWRGAFGHAFKRVSCTTQAKNCNTCLLKTQCAYGYIFESSPNNDSDRMRKYNAIPHPYVIKNNKHTQIAAKDTFDLTFILFGKANDYLAYIIQAFKNVGKKGITSQKAKFSINCLKKKNNNGFDIIWEHTENQLKHTTTNKKTPLPKYTKKETNTLQIKFETPIKILRDGQQLTPEKLQLSDIIKSLTRRISMLSYFHSNQKIELDYSHIHKQAETINWDIKTFKQVYWKRYSNRQKRVMKVRGIVGEATFTLSNQHQIIRQLLNIGSQIHAGKLTTMGLGEYCIKNTP